MTGCISEVPSGKLVTHLVAMYNSTVLYGHLLCYSACYRTVFIGYYRSASVRTTDLQIFLIDPVRGLLLPQPYQPLQENKTKPYISEDDNDYNSNDNKCEQLQLLY